MTKFETSAIAGFLLSGAPIEQICAVSGKTYIEISLIKHSLITNQKIKNETIPSRIIRKRTDYDHAGERCKS